MGGMLENKYVFEKDNLEQSDKYFLFENPQIGKISDPRKEEKKFKKFENVRNFIDDSIFLKFLILMIFINPFFKFIIASKIILLFRIFFR